MAVRTREIKVRMSDDEFDLLNEKVQECGMSREKFIRLVLSDYQPKQLPPIEYFKLIKELNGNGNNLNQLTKLTYLQGIDISRLNDVLNTHERILLELDKQVRGNV